MGKMEIVSSYSNIFRYTTYLTRANGIQPPHEWLFQKKHSHECDIPNVVAFRFVGEIPTAGCFEAYAPIFQ